MKNLKAFRKETNVLILQLQEAKTVAGEVGLYKTMHAIDEATKVIGWEIADVLQGKAPYVVSAQKRRK